MVATIASPTPVLPLVGSIIVAPGFNAPRASASSIIASPTRSFTLPAGLNDSSLATISRCNPYFPLYPANFINGVPPISSVKFFAIFAIIITYKTRRYIKSKIIITDKCIILLRHLLAKVGKKRLSLSFLNKD